MEIKVENLSKSFKKNIVLKGESETASLKNSITKNITLIVVIFFVELGVL